MGWSGRGFIWQHVDVTWRLPQHQIFSAIARDLDQANVYAKFKGKVQGSPTGERDNRLYTLLQE